MKPSCIGRPQCTMEMPVQWDDHQEQQQQWSGKVQSLEFAQMVSYLDLVQYFLTMTFWNGNIYPVRLEACDLLFNFNFIGDCSEVII